MKVFFGTIAVLSLCSCNIMGFMDKPKGDVQLLEAARACLDQGDYNCARDYYQALSNNYLDIKISETTLLNLAGKNIFFMADLVRSLGDGTGSTSSFTLLAQTMASRGITDATSRVTLQSEYTNALTISDVTLKDYMRFATSMAMMGHILANAVGSDGLLTASDLVVTPSTCKAAGVCATATSCDKPTGSTLINTSTTTETIDLPTATNWNTEPSLDKLLYAFNEVDDSLNNLSGTSSGLASALNAIQAMGGGASTATARCTRQLLVQQFFP